MRELTEIRGNELTLTAQMTMRGSKSKRPDPSTPRSTSHSSSRDARAIDRGARGARASSRPTSPASALHDEAACAFAGSYEAARAQFRSLSRASGASFFSLPIASNGSWPPLSIDVAALRRAQQHADAAADDRRQPAFVHVSGTHGAEGYSGSAVQPGAAAAVGGRPGGAAGGVRVALVQLNLFGFHHGRRWNETASTSTAIC